MGIKRVLIVVALLVAGLAGLVYTQLRDDGLPADIHVLTAEDDMDEHLQRFKKDIGGDYEGYRNHNLRVLSFALHFLRDIGVTPKEKKALAIAAAYHDVGLWSDRTLRYLTPSYIQSLKHVNEDLLLIHDCIEYHHKLTPFKSEHGHRHDALVNAFRKADWIDASLGVVSHGMRRANVLKAQKELPNKGFHDALARFSLQWNGFQILSILRW